MSNSMTVISVITSKILKKSFTVGTAVYRPNPNKYKYFDFKFYNGNNKDINSFEEGDLVVLSGKFTYRRDVDDNPIFLSVNQAIKLPSNNEWDLKTMPVSHPYITASVFLAKDPLQQYNGHNIIKSQCNNIYCSFNKSKYDHDFYLYYNDETTRWTKTLPAIKQGNMKIHISGLYSGYYAKAENKDNIYHAIQITELDFDSKLNKILDDNDDDDILFGTPLQSSPSSSKKDKRKYDQTFSESSESDKSSSSDNNKKKKKKSVKKSKTNKIEESTKIKQELPYEKLPASKAIQSLNESQAKKQPSAQHNPYLNLPHPLPPQSYDNPNYPHYPYYYPYHQPHEFNPYNNPSHTTTETNTNEEIDDKDKKTVQFALPVQNDDTSEPSSNQRGKKSTRGRGGAKARGQKSKTNPTRKSPRKKGGILNIAVDKIADDDDEVLSKSGSFMDTESDYNTQNDEEMHENDDVSD